MRISIFRLAPIILIALSACTSKLDQLRNSSPEGGNYTRILSQTYLNQANQKASGMHYPVSEFLSEKGLRVSGGEAIFADSIANWDVPADKIQELASARQLLKDAYKDELNLEYPKLIAKAQVAFDTWISELYYGHIYAANRAKNAMIEALSKVAVTIKDSYSSVKKKHPKNKDDHSRGR